MTSFSPSPQEERTGKAADNKKIASFLDVNRIAQAPEIGRKLPVWAATDAHPSQIYSNPGAHALWICKGLVKYQLN